MSLSERIDEASIGLAAINSLIEIVDEAIVPVNASDILMDTGRGKNIAIIGHFPFVEDLKKGGKKSLGHREKAKARRLS